MRIGYPQSLGDDGASNDFLPPLLIGVLADLRGEAPTNARPIEGRKFLPTDVGNLDARIALLASRVTLTLGDASTGGELPAELAFDRLEDFSPAGVAGKVPALAALVGLRQRMCNLVAELDGRANPSPPG